MRDKYNKITISRKLEKTTLKHAADVKKLGELIIYGYSWQPEKICYLAMKSVQNQGWKRDQKQSDEWEQTKLTKFTPQMQA